MNTPQLIANLDLKAMKIDYYLGAKEVIKCREVLETFPVEQIAYSEILWGDVFLFSSQSGGQSIIWSGIPLLEFFWQLCNFLHKNRKVTQASSLLSDTNQAYEIEIEKDGHLLYVKSHTNSGELKVCIKSSSASYHIEETMIKLLSDVSLLIPELKNHSLGKEIEKMFSTRL